MACEAPFFSSLLIRCVSATFIPLQSTERLTHGLAVCPLVQGRDGGLLSADLAVGEKPPGGHPVRFRYWDILRLSHLRPQPGPGYAVSRHCPYAWQSIRYDVRHLYCRYALALRLHPPRIRPCAAFWQTPAHDRKTIWPIRRSVVKRRKLCSAR